MGRNCPHLYNYLPHLCNFFHPDCSIFAPMIVNLLIVVLLVVVEVFLFSTSDVKCELHTSQLVDFKFSVLPLPYTTTVSVNVVDYILLSEVDSFCYRAFAGGKIYGFSCRFSRLKPS